MGRFGARCRVRYQVVHRQPCLPRHVLLASMQGSKVRCCSTLTAANSLHTLLSELLHITDMLVVHVVL